LKVNFYANLRSIVGQKSIEVEITEETTALQLVDLVTEQCPALHAELLDAENRFQRHIKMFINGREVIYLDDQFETIIHPEDKIDIFPPVGGG
jgi:MoaD family protein